MPTVCTARWGMSLSGHPRTFRSRRGCISAVWRGDRCGVLRRTDLGKMHADLPMGEQTMRLVCNVALAGLKELTREP